MLGPFAVDMYLPAFPAIGAELGASSIALAADAVGVSVRVRVHDALARRAVRCARAAGPIILGGLAIFALGTLGCAIAGNIESLWLFRGAAGPLGGRGRGGGAGHHPRPLSTAPKRNA